MKNLIVPLLVVVAASRTFAGPAEDVTAAAKKLADAPNYSWTRTVENAGGGGGGGGAGPTEGVTEKNGVTLTTRTGQNGAMQTVRKGEHMVMQNQEGAWVTREEMMAQFGGGAGGAGGAGAGARGGRGGMFGAPVNPAEELAALVAQTKDLKVTDGAIVGVLTDEAVAQRLSIGGRGGQAAAAPKNAAGSVKIWLKDGAVTKYQLHVKGTVTGRNGEQERDTTSTTEIKNVGTSKVTVPEEAKKKLGA